ncbi:MAG: mechanosensitive ion channel [Acidobacteria bacterium]|nr:mechanosensitive ion channel [Acidobacteriota bacterium]
MFDHVLENFSQFSIFDYVILVLNILVLVFSRRIVATIPSYRGGREFGARLMALRILTILLFLLYTIGLVETELLQRIGKTAITILMAYLMSHLIHVLLQYKFGRDREVDGEMVRVESYQSEIFNLLSLVLIGTTSLVAIINIWDMTSWLQTTSALGFLLIITFSTKDVWAPDSINGLILLYNEAFQPGTVIRCRELNILGVILEIKITETVIRDLRQRHELHVPNAKLRSCNLEVLSNSTKKGLIQFLDFNLAYGLNSEDVVAFFEDAWKLACSRETSINDSSKCRVRLFSNGDHAVTWRVFFAVRQVYKTLSAEYAFNQAAYDLSLERGIGLNTPTTHLVEQTAIPPVFDDAGTPSGSLDT